MDSTVLIHSMEEELHKRIVSHFTRTVHVNGLSLPIVNNPVENAIHPIAPGKKNWLFSGS